MKESTPLPSLDEAISYPGHTPPQSFLSETLELIRQFQDSAENSFSTVLTAAKEARAEFEAYLLFLNSGSRSPWCDTTKEKLLTRMIIETVAPSTTPRLFHISLGHQFSRMFLKRRKIV